MSQRSILSKLSFWCIRNSTIAVQSLWKKVFCFTCCEQGPRFNYVWSLEANIQSPSEGKKKSWHFFLFIFFFGWLFWVFDTLTFCSLWMCPGYTYRVSWNWPRAVKPGFLDSFKHSPQCPVSTSLPPSPLAPRDRCQSFPLVWTGIWWVY